MWFMDGVTHGRACEATLSSSIELIPLNCDRIVDEGVLKDHDPGNADYSMYSTFLTVSPGSVLFSSSNLFLKWFFLEGGNGGHGDGRLAFDVVTSVWSDKSWFTLESAPRCSA
jgi:hypothetical protein